MSEYYHERLAEKIPEASPDALDLLKSMLQFDPAKRIKIEEILNHNFFGFRKSMVMTDSSSQSIITQNTMVRKPGIFIIVWLFSYEIR